MIVEAFSEHLQEAYAQGEKPLEVFHGWLTHILNHPPHPTDMVARVIHAEIAMTPVLWSPSGELQSRRQIGAQPQLTTFEGRSKTGQNLLNTLYHYCQSYENWQFRRWLHDLRANDFSSPHSS